MTSRRGRRAITLGGALIGTLLSPTSNPVAAQSGDTSQSLSRRIDARIDTPPLDRTLWGIALTDESGRLLYGRNEHRLFVPASNLKLVVSAAATVLLPSDGTVRTSLYSAGPITDGVLRGDLVLYGRGDPTFSERCYALDTTAAGACETDASARFRQLAAALRARGVRAIHGNIVGDGSYFETQVIHPGWENFDLMWWYAAPVSGLGFHDNSIDFRWRPGARRGDAAVITMTPDFGDVTFDNRTKTVAAGGTTDIGNRFFRVPGTLKYWAEGTVALDRSPHTESAAHPDPNLYAARALRQALLDGGIPVTGAARSTTDSSRYRALRAKPPLAEVDSRPLRDWIFPILNTSQNWFAEMTLKQLGRQRGGAGSWKTGLSVERRFLIDSVGIDSTQFSLVDASGLAGNNYISPFVVTQLLRYMRRHPNYATFAAGLPVAGARGSLRARFVGSPLAGRVRAKTGSIAGIHTLSGYVQTADGKTLVFSILANHHIGNAKTMLGVIDSVVAEMGR